MLFKVEVEEFWLDKDEDLSKELKQFITQKISQRVSNIIDDGYSDAIKESAKNIIEAEIAPRLNQLIHYAIEQKNVVVDGRFISIDDYVKKVFEQTEGWDSPISVIRAAANRFGERMRFDHDVRFLKEIVKSVEKNIAFMERKNKKSAKLTNSQR